MMRALLSFLTSYIFSISDPIRTCFCGHEKRCIRFLCPLCYIFCLYPFEFYNSTNLGGLC